MGADVFDRSGGRKYLNEAERLAFFEATEDEPDKLRRSFCLTVLYTGCRISEALNLTRNRLDSSQKCVVFETLKRRLRGVYREVPIPDSLVALLGEVAEGVPPAARLWPFSRATAYRMVRRLSLKAGIKGGMACPKGLRHGFAVACVAKNVPLPTIKNWLGHARLETTAIYLGVSGKEERDFARRLWFKR